MAKATKTWKIGEYCKGGIISVEVTDKVIHIIGKEWDNSTGYNKSSNQSNAKEWTRYTANVTDRDAYLKCLEFLEDLTTVYYADTIMNWLDTKVQFKPTFI